MQKFIRHIFVFVLLFLGIVLVLDFLHPIGQKGENYERHISEQTISMICGTSMAALDIEPDILAEQLHDLYPYKPYNYSFSIDVSPYGEVYTNAIMHKLKNYDGRSALYILCVDPFSLGETSGDDSAKHTYREQRMQLAKLRKFYGRPNIRYYISNVLTTKQAFHIFPSQDGKIEQNGRYCSSLRYETDSANVLQRINNLIIPYYYRDCVPNFRLSSYRMQNLLQLTRHLSSRGDVYWVRPVVGKELTNIMDSIAPSFDSLMNNLSCQIGVPYINFHYRINDYHTTDGVHLYYDDGNQFTYDLCDSIRARKVVCK